jgi:hypothetical protein
MTARIVRCFGHSVKDKERAILATRSVANTFKNRISIFVALWVCEKISPRGTPYAISYVTPVVCHQSPY